MEFEWDERKRAANIERHGIDFVRAALAFDGRPVVTLPSRQSGEERFLTTAILDERFVTIVWTWRDEAIRIISARSARDGERQAYNENHGRAG